MCCWDLESSVLLRILLLTFLTLPFPICWWWWRKDLFLAVGFSATDLWWNYMWLVYCYVLGDAWDYFRTSYCSEVFIFFCWLLLQLMKLFFEYRVCYYIHSVTSTFSVIDFVCWWDVRKLLRLIHWACFFVEVVSIITFVFINYYKIATPWFRLSRINDKLYLINTII